LGGAEGLYLDDRIGNFLPGKEADFVALDWNAGPSAVAWHGSLILDGGGLEIIKQASDLLFSIMTTSDDRAVDETWIMGKRAYKKA